MPVFTPDSSFFPKRTLQESSPVGGILADAIAKRLAFAKAQEAENEAPYSGLAKLASIRSQNAYANAVTPQFQAKLLGIPGAIDSLQHPQTTLRNLENYGTTTGNSVGNSTGDFIEQELRRIAQKRNQPNLLGGLMNWISGNSGSSSRNDNYSTGSNGSTGSIISPQAVNTANNGYSYDNSGRSVPMPQEQIDWIANHGNSVPWPGNNQAPQTSTSQATQFRTNQAKGSQIVKTGEALGTESGKQIAEYGDEAAGVVDQDQALHNLNSIIQQPVIRKIADTPFVNQHSIEWYKQTGTRDEKRAAGELESALNTYVGSSLKMFPGRVTNNDLLFIQGMKPAKTDTIDVIQGKIAALKTYNEARKQNVALQSRLMAQGYTKADAVLAASSQVNMDQIRDQAHVMAFPAPVVVQDTEGHRVELPLKGAQQLVKDHKGYRILEPGTY